MEYWILFYLLVHNLCDSLRSEAQPDSVDIHTCVTPAYNKEQVLQHLTLLQILLLSLCWFPTSPHWIKIYCSACLSSRSLSLASITVRIPLWNLNLCFSFFICLSTYAIMMIVFLFQSTVCSSMKKVSCTLILYSTSSCFCDYSQGEGGFQGMRQQNLCLSMKGTTKHIKYVIYKKYYEFIKCHLLNS